MDAPIPGDDLPRHGGDLTFARDRYGEPPEGWLDLSTGINPYPYPAAEVAAADLRRLPDRRQLAALIDAARSAYAVPDTAAIVAVPGTEAAVHAIPLLLTHQAAIIVGPTYGSHGQAWFNSGRQVIDVNDFSNVAPGAAVVVTNPNNPDGRTHSPGELAALAGKLAENGGLLIVDEAFADLTPDLSLMPHLADLNAIVLRSFGKFFGLAGLRLGFVAGEPALVQRLEQMLGDWPVSGPALTIGQAALRDKTWIRKARNALRISAARLRDTLVAARLNPIGGTDLFILIDMAGAPHLHRHLAEQGIWTRAFAERPTWLRFGLPPDDAGFARLDKALAEFTSPAAGRLPTRE